MKFRMAWMLPAVLLLGSCQTWGPTWSEVSGNMPNIPPSENDAPTSVQNIDGSGAFPNGPGQPIKMTVGTHHLLLAAIPMTAWPGGTELKTMTLVAEPCVRYYINAHYDSRLSMEWKPYIGFKESISDCTVPGQK
jgi:hypothetical protein